MKKLSLLLVIFVQFIMHPLLQTFRKYLIYSKYLYKMFCQSLPLTEWQLEGSPLIILIAGDHVPLTNHLWLILFTLMENNFHLNIYLHLNIESYKFIQRTWINARKASWLFFSVCPLVRKHFIMVAYFTENIS